MCDTAVLNKSEGDAAALPRGSMEACESSEGTWAEAAQGAPGSETPLPIAEESAEASGCTGPPADTAIRPPAAGPGGSGPEAIGQCGQAGGGGLRDARAAGALCCAQCAVHSGAPRDCADPGVIQLHQEPLLS